MLPRIAIVGRPNVGKSSLLNMVAHAKVSIVDPTPGVTRDRVSAIVTLEAPFKGDHPKQVEFIDTGGFGVYHEPGSRFDEIGNDLKVLSPGVERQIGAAISKADLVLFAIDAQAGITAPDLEIARLLREQRLGRRDRANGQLIPVRVIATKVDGPKWEAHAHELSALGFGEPLMCSAKNNYMRRDMLDALWHLVPEGEPEGDQIDYGLRLAVVGKRNAGKSTLVNHLAGEERVIVSEIPGTTRDAIDVQVVMGDQKFTIIDTAGLRRKKSFQGQIEWYAFDRVQRAIDRADVILMLVDATTRISQVDEQIAMLAQKAFKPVVIVINKWDLAEGQPGRQGRPVTVEDFERYIRRELKGLDFAPLAFMSGLTGLNVRGTIELAFDVARQSRTRIGTGKLNRVLRKLIELRPPPNKLGTQAKLFYVAQTGVAPPTMTFFVSYPELFTPNYQRFLMNRIRENTPFEEVPIRLFFKDRSRTLQSERGRPLPEEFVSAEDASAFFDEPAEPTRPGMPPVRVIDAQTPAEDAGDAPDHFDEKTILAEWESIEAGEPEEINEPARADDPHPIAEADDDDDLDDLDDDESDEDADDEGGDDDGPIIIDDDDDDADGGNEDSIFAPVRGKPKRPNATPQPRAASKPANAKPKPAGAKPAQKPKAAGGKSKAPATPAKSSRGKPAANTPKPAAGKAKPTGAKAKPNGEKSKPAGAKGKHSTRTPAAKPSARPTKNASSARPSAPKKDAKSTPRSGQNTTRGKKPRGRN